MKNPFLPKSYVLPCDDDFVHIPFNDWSCVLTSSTVAVVRGFIVVVVVVVVVIAIADWKNVNVINMGTPCPVSI